MALGDELATRYREGLLGRVKQVLLEERQPDGGWAGYTPEYVHVRVANGAAGALVNARLDLLTSEGMSGTVVE